MLLFVRNPFYSAICEGRKAFELRAGSRYANVRVGDELSINGRFRVRVTRIEQFTDPHEAARATERAGYLVTEQQIRDCYPNLSGPLRLFHFDAPATMAACQPRLALDS